MSVSDKPNKIPCPYCDKGEIHNRDIPEAGTNVENRDYLRDSILKLHYGGIAAVAHPLSTGRKQNCAQAHHLICCESMDDDEWGVLCNVFGYNINCPENGVILPANMSVACKLHIPLHRGHHDATETNIYSDMTYVEGVRGLIDSVRKKAKRKGYCEELEGKVFIQDLNNISKLIWNNLKSFSWTLTSDGKDYDTGGNGCSNQTSIRKKRSTPCSSGRSHPELPVTIPYNFKER
jgi:hypothetical protein